MPSRIRTITAALLALTTALLVALTACAGASTTGEADPADTSTPETATSDPAALEARARSYLLTLDDLPAGWTVEPPEPDSESESDDPDYPGDIPPECDAFISDDDLPGTLIEVDSEEFDGGEDGGSVDSTATIMESPETAAEAFDLVHRALATCHDTFVEVFRYYFEQEAAEGAEIGDPPQHVEVTILDVVSEEVTFPVHGDGTLAWRIASVIQYGDVAIPVVIDSVAIRVADAIASFTYTYSINAPDAPLHQQELAAILERNLQTPTP